MELSGKRLSFAIDREFLIIIPRRYVAARIHGICAERSPRRLCNRRCKKARRVRVKGIG